MMMMMTRTKLLSTMMADVNDLLIVSYNMRGYFQGIEVVKDLVNSAKSPDIILLQEHWLTPAKMYLFNNISSHYAFGKSAMAERVALGPLVGRPYGGTTILIKNELLAISECIFCADRYVVVKVGNLVIINMYLPCVGTADRMCIIEDVLQEAWSWYEKYSECSVVIGGDLNTDLDKDNEVSRYINNFLTDHSLVRCDTLYPNKQQSTFVNEPLGHSSVIDYFISDMAEEILDYCVLDPDINLSDHLPIAIRCNCIYPVASSAAEVKKEPKVKQLRWDHADLLSYYNTTMSLLYPLYYELLEFSEHLLDISEVERQILIDNYYNKLVNTLRYSAELHVPLHYKNYYKFWWSEELTCLKDKAIESSKIWKEAGRPRTGPIADLRNGDKRNYNRKLRNEQQAETQHYTNDLHEALISKSGDNFWKCWNSKFEKGNKSCKFIDGLADDVQIAEAFAKHFRSTCTSLNNDQNDRLRLLYLDKRHDYIGDPHLNMYTFDAELIESVLANMKRGKAAGLDELTVEHLTNSHPVLLLILTELFKVIMSAAHVPYGFRLSYTVPLPKDDTTYKRNTVDSYRAISISRILSKIFEQCMLLRYSKFLITSPNQFGFKKGYSCSHAIYSVRRVVDYYVNGGSMVNLCLLDLSKAFDKMNHYALYIKLMNKSVPLCVLSVLENWYSLCLSCVKWGSTMSYFYELKTGVRQGGVLSPVLFGIFIDDLVTLVNDANIGCRIGMCCVAIFLYADDIILLAPSVQALQSLVNICVTELNFLDMAINTTKSSCMRYGSRYVTDRGATPVECGRVKLSFTI